MLDNIELIRQFDETRSIEKLDIKMSPRDKYILMQYEKKMGIENRTTYIRRLIESDIVDKIKKGFVEIQ